MVSSVNLTEEARIDRIKQKAIRSANKELGGNLEVPENQDNAAEIDVNFLASVLGMDVLAFREDHPSPAKSSKKKKKKKSVATDKENSAPKQEKSSPEKENGQKHESPVSLAGTSLVGANLVRAQAGSLAAALGISIDPSANAPAMRKKEESKIATEKSEATPAVVAPQPGSLAAALGMSVEQANGDAASNASEASPTEKTEKPQPGSLAAALGMQVSSSPRAPVAQVEAETVTPKAGSLAAALGVRIDVAKNAPAIRKSSVGSAAQEKTLGKAAPGSLAAALGMYVDSSPSSPPIRNDVTSAQPDQGATVLQKPQKGSLADALGLSVDTSTSSHAATARPSPTTPSLPPKTNYAAPGSLAAALGMKVDPALSAAPIREVGKAPPAVQPHQGTTFVGAQEAPAQAGSLAAALGMSVDLSKSAPPIRFSPPTSDNTMRRPRSLADMVMSRVASAGSISDSSVEDDEDDNSNDGDSLVESECSTSSDGDFFEQNHKIVAAQGGSLADALGIKIDVSTIAGPIRKHNESNPASQPRRRGLEASTTTTTVEGILGDQFSDSQAKALVTAMNMLLKSHDVKSGIPAVLLPDQQTELEGVLKEHFSAHQVKSLVAAFGIFAGSSSPSVVSRDFQLAATPKNGSNPWVWWLFTFVAFLVLLSLCLVVSCANIHAKTKNVQFDDCQSDFLSGLVEQSGMSDAVYSWMERLETNDFACDLVERLIRIRDDISNMIRI